MKSGGADYSNPLWNVAETASFLRIHQKTLYDWAGRGKIPCVRIGSRLRFDPQDITRWVAARREV